MTAPQHAASRELAKLHSIVSRREHDGQNVAARRAFGGAYRAVLAVEDADGIQAAGALADRLTDLRQRAMRVGLLTAGDVCEVETGAVAEAVSS